MLIVVVLGSSVAGSPLQCAHGIFNLDQKFHGLSFSWGFHINVTAKKQSRKTSVIRLPKFTTVNMAKECPQNGSFSLETLLF